MSFTCTFPRFVQNYFGKRQSADFSWEFCQVSICMAESGRHTGLPVHPLGGNWRCCDSGSAVGTKLPVVTLALSNSTCRQKLFYRISIQHHNLHSNGGKKFSIALMSPRLKRRFWDWTQRRRAFNCSTAVNTRAPYSCVMKQKSAKVLKWK